MRKVVLEDGRTMFEVMGQFMTEEEFDRHFLTGEQGEPGSSLCGWHKPVLSDALCVHPRQIPEAMARDKKHGLNVEYLPDGRPVLTSQDQKRKMIRSLGYHENNCAY